MALSRLQRRWFIFGLAALILVVALAVAIPLATGAAINSGNNQEMFRGRSVLYEVPLIDGHNDLPWNLYNNEKNQLENFDFDSDLKQHPVWGQSTSSHTDLPRLRTGLLSGQFWVAYVDCKSQHKDAVELTMQQIDVIKRLIKKYPNDLKYATTADEIMEAFNEKKIASMIVVEGGHSIDDRLSVLRLYYELGVRYMTLTHSCNQPWIDASPIDTNATAVKRDLTEWGKSVVLEMNRLGMMVDLSHVSYGVMNAVLAVAQAPVIFSHSSSYTKYPHHRNVQDDVLLKLKTNNGIVMVNFYSEFIAGPDATINDVVAHLNYIKSLIGPDHIGIGGDYDGVDKTPVGLEDVSKYPELFDLLATSGLGYDAWTAEELRKLAGENILRVMREVEQVSKNMANNAPIETNIPDADIYDYDKDQTCKTDFNYPGEEPQ